ncbi:hypothetical protein FVQ98_04090 [Ottowia sp. GY511]|uniref:IPTL-CTERM sorting domain-containing protein n=1 Tax=Ottowia flava TaxID=2675430 RepID=A0ABW4KSQ6_9BURK|nr:hypothetical protein [Ottowia sp. GY511]TXK33168.1 hypothetical protein FVQ98_04090 [Ottowia sp. GY511]
MRRSHLARNTKTTLLGGLLLLVAAAGAHAQTQFTLSGVDYELVNWPAAAFGTNSLSSDTGSAAFGAATFAVTANGGLVSDPTVVNDFFNGAVYATPGYGITGTPSLNLNQGQIYTGGADTVVTYTVTATTLPTELIYYAGAEILDENSGMKYARWAWTSSQPGTVFEVINQTSTVTVTGSGTGTMSWKTFRADNNSAKALVRITNPAGISNFTITSNRLSASGVDFVYTAPAPAADFSGSAILVPRPAAPPTPVPTLGGGMLALLFAAMVLGARWSARRRG